METEDFDGLLFDVDGVLVDVTRSYPSVIRAAVQWGWARLLGRVADRTAYTREHERVTKNHRAFNDDYDIAWALLAAAASGGERRLSRAFPSPRRWEEELSRFAGDDPVPWVRERFGDLPPGGDGTPFRDAVRSFCDRLYVEGFGGWGLYRLERPLLRVSWRDLGYPVGIYTGRPWRELRLALRLLGWEDFPQDHAVTPDDGILKPSPEGLAELCRRLGIRRPLYFGDAASDEATHRAFGRGTFVAVGPTLARAPRRFDTTGQALEALLPPGRYPTIEKE